MQIFALDVPAVAFGVLASLAGWGMMTYTAALLAQMATPLWAAAPRLLGVRFAASAMATGAASLCIAGLMLGTSSWYAREFGNIAAASLFAELLAAGVALLACAKQGVAGPLLQPPWAPLYFGGAIFVGALAPIGVFIAADLIEPNAILRFAAGSSVLFGGLMMRFVVLEAGNESARRPRDYFRWAGASPRMAAT
jgi:formate-dependent nitrite reductase membrane component NrfD